MTLEKPTPKGLSKPTKSKLTSSKSTLSTEGASLANFVPLLSTDTESRENNWLPIEPLLRRSDRMANGKKLREATPRSDHALWSPRPDRLDPVALVEQSNQGRMQQLVPVRHARMMESPFAFYRGTALNMAADLANTPASGIQLQVCGDCHLLNFGAFATPERRMIFDINDLDETLKAPWEWDLKRLATSFVLASRHNGFDEHTAMETAIRCVEAYRQRTLEYSEKTVLETWYDRIDIQDMLSTIHDAETKERAEKRLQKAREHDVMAKDFPELTTQERGRIRIKDAPPLIFHWADQNDPVPTDKLLRGFQMYRESLQEDRRELLDRFQLVDIAFKVVGVGSVGTLCGILLLMASESDPLFLQIKQARASVLEPYAAKGYHANHGERIVHGYRMMQAASDIFLGWTEGPYGQFFIRQLKDMKIKPLVDLFTPKVMMQYAEWCGWTLAHAHARSGKAAEVAGYLGKSDKFDTAIVSFSVAYADQVEQDFEKFIAAIRSGKLEVFRE